MAIDKIGSKALTDCSVAAADIAPGTITATKLAGSITNAKLANSSVTINSTAIALGASASINSVSWQSVVASDGSTVTTMVAGRGYFINNTSAAGIVKLPTSASAGDTIAIKDYAGNFGTNSLTIQRNGHKIQGVTNDGLIKTNRASVVLVYVDATKGWLYSNESNVADLQLTQFTEATGGTVTTTGNFKVHTFTGDGNFVVSQIGIPSPAGGGPAAVDYMVVAGGAAGGNVGGGGAGGYREGRTNAPDYTASPLVAPAGLTVAVQTYPITVGGGGAAPNNTTYGTGGSNSVFSTITSAGGGGGPAGPFDTGRNGQNGGSAGGGHGTCSGPGTGGTGNTPPVSPPQGNNGGNAGNTPGTRAVGGGGGGAGAVGAEAPGSPDSTGAAGGAGVTSHITGSPVTRAGGGGGGRYHYGGGGTSGSGGSGGGGAGGGGISPSPSAKNATNGSANTGSAGGGAGIGNCGHGLIAGTGGKGIVIIRYKYQ